MLTGPHAAELIAEAVTWRHHLHQHPELAYQEHTTAEFIASQLARFGLSVHGGLAGTGVVGTLTRGTSRRTIAIRADMDALPIEETSGVPYASCHKGVMHACGHDGHVAIALAAARTCSQLANLDGTVHFVFQPAEENEGGAKRMVEEGLFRRFPCDAIYALHNWPTLPLGTCVARDDAMMAALALFEIELSGRGCHGAMPHEGSDVLLSASHIVTALQSIASRNIDSMKAAVISVTQLHGGSTWNVIPSTCIIRGTTRCFDDETSDLLEKRIAEIATGVATSLSCEASVRYERRMPVTVNAPAEAARIRDLAQAPPLNLSVVAASPSMASEDFAYMLQAVPGCYFWLGSAKPGNTFGLHSPSFDFNDDLLPLGVSFWISLVQHCLAVT